MKPVQLSEEFHKKLKMLSAKSGTKIKDLIEEALDLLFEKYSGEIK